MENEEDILIYSNIITSWYEYPHFTFRILKEFSQDYGYDSDIEDEMDIYFSK